MKRIVVLALVFNAALLGVIVHLLAGPGAPRMRAHAAGNRAVAEAEIAKGELLRVCAAEGFEFTSKLRRAFLVYARQQALRGLEMKGKALPESFLAWVDADPEIAAGVYAAHDRPEDVLLWLYSLRLDLGKKRFEKYRQLALAAALVSSKEGMEADIKPRKPLKLVIPGDPRKPVDTKEPGRKLDMNDHIINFLNEHTIEEEVLVDSKGVPELRYDKKGIAIPSPGKQKRKKGQATTKRTRTLYAADVLASKELQAKFNSYMKSRGYDTRIDCGERVVHWKSKDMVRGEQYRKVNEAYLLFRRAYEAKGLMPAKRDAFPSPAERCAYLIRNHEYKFPPKLQAKRKWPRFPLTAPWPLLTMLAADRQPLREREERWVAFRDKGEFHQYGEYIGGIAQQQAMQSARRLTPYPFTYATIQIMLKDGGVCGTMGSISARGHNTLGIPASQATQPGHCAMVSFRYDPKTRIYRCQGGQYATGGDEKTGPFTPWPFASKFRRINRRNGYEIEFHNRKPMVYHQSLAWGVNYSLQSYLDGTVAHAVFRLLPEGQRQAHGLKLLESALVRNVYNFLLVDAAQDTAATAQEQILFWKGFRAALRAVGGKPGCPAEGLYNTTVKNRMFDRIARLPVPKDKESARRVLSFLEEEKCSNAKTLAAYRRALKGQ